MPEAAVTCAYEPAAGEHVPILTGYGCHRSLDLPLRLLLRARIAVIAFRGGEDRLLLGAVDPVAVRVDEHEVGQVGRARVNRRVLRRAVPLVRVAVTIGIRHGR